MMIIVKIKIIIVLLLVSVITASSITTTTTTATATATATAAATAAAAAAAAATSSFSQSVQEEEVLPLSDQSFGSSTINLSNENSYDQQIAAVANKSYVVWTDEATGNGDIYFKRSIDNGASFSNTPINLSNNTGRSEDPQIAAVTTLSIPVHHDIVVHVTN